MLTLSCLPTKALMQGLAPLEGCQGETHTTGLDTLRERCQEYHKQVWLPPALSAHACACSKHQLTPASAAGKEHDLQSGGQLCP